MTEHRARRRGGVVVEMALVIPVLITMLFGMLEFGMMFSEQTVLTHAAREGARAASLGATTSRILDTIATCTGTLRAANLATPILRYRTWNGSSWSAWQTLTDSGDTNCARSGDQVSVSLQYTHALVTGPWLMPLFGGQRQVPLTASICMRRE